MLETGLTHCQSREVCAGHSSSFSGCFRVEIDLESDSTLDCLLKDSGRFENFLGFGAEISPLYSSDQKAKDVIALVLEKEFGL